MSASEVETLDITEENDLTISHEFSMQKCLVCFGDINKTVARPLSITQKVFNSCCKHLHSVITRETLSGKWDYRKQKQLPFCQECFDNALELTQLNDQLEKFQKNVNEFVLSFSLTILNRRSLATSPDDANEQYRYKNKLEHDIMVYYPENDKQTDENQYFEDDVQSLYKNNNGNDSEVESMEVKCELPYDLQESYYEDKEDEEVEEEEYGDDFTTGDEDTFDGSSHADAEYSYEQQQQPAAAGPSSKLENGMSRIRRIIHEKYQTQNPQLKIQKLTYNQQDGSVIVPEEEPEAASPSKTKLQSQKSLQMYRNQVAKLKSKMNNDNGHGNYGRGNTAGHSSVSSISSIVKNLNVASSQNRKMLTKQAPTTGNTQLYKCRYCFQGFRQIQLLAKHERTHTKPEGLPFKCPKCSKRFKSQSNVNSHLLTHSGQKSFTCDYCNYATYWVSNLKTHQRTHTGEMPYKCRECSIRFKTYQVGVNHYKKFHPENEFTRGCLLFESNLSELDLICL